MPCGPGDHPHPDPDRLRHSDAAPSPTPTAVAPSAGPSATPTTGPTATPTPTPTPTVPLPVVTAVDKKAGHAASSRTATMTGTRFLNLASVQIAGVPAGNLQVLSDTQARFVIPNAIDYQAKIAAITVTAKSDPTPRDTGLTFQYKVDGPLDREMAYAFRYWNVYIERDVRLPQRQRLRELRQPDAARTRVDPVLPVVRLRSRELERHLGVVDRAQHLVDEADGPRDPSHVLAARRRDGRRRGPVPLAGAREVVHGVGSHGDRVQGRRAAERTHDIYYVAHTLNRQYGGGTAGLASWYAAQKIKGSTLRIQFFHLLK